MGNLAYFSLLHQYDHVILEVNQHFTKQTFKNRYEILTSQGRKSLSIPVHFDNRTPLKDVRIDYRQSWMKDHMGAIRSAYSKTPFFDDLYPYFIQLFERKPEKLIDLSYPILTTCLNLLAIKSTIRLTENYELKPYKDIFDGREIISPKNKIGVDEFYLPKSYIQNFGKSFAPNLSILDALFNLGLETTALLKP